MNHLRRFAFGAFVAFFMTFTATAALADDPPSRVARLSFTSGEVSMQPGGVNDWAAAVLNRPFTTADRLWTDQSSRAELQLGGAAVRMESQTSLTLTNVADNVLQVELDQGTLDLHVARLFNGEIYEVDTPNAAFTVFKPGDYRFDVDSKGDATLATVWKGKLVATGQGPEVQIDSHHQAQFSSGQSMFHRMSKAPAYDGFDDWCRVRDEREARVLSARYVSPDVIGYEDLDGYGAWRELPQYGGPVWFPTVEAGWAPYHYGHWVWVEPWGWTWVDNASWGFAPFHYGRWVFAFDRWGWVPGPVRVRPVYAPALVVWAGGNAGGVAWFPLGYGEPYVPYYHVSRTYFETVNVSNTHITNITYVTNTYYNRNVQITNIHYRNEGVPGAVIMVRNETIVNSRSVDRDRIEIHGRDWREHGVFAGPPVPPSRESVLGAHRDGPIARPIIEHPRVVVKQAPPAERVPFEARRDAIAGNAGRPLDRDEEQRLRAQMPEHRGPDWNNSRDDHRADNNSQRDHDNRGNTPEHGNDARRADNDSQRDHADRDNRGNAQEHGNDGHRAASQDDSAAHQPGDRGHDAEHNDNSNNRRNDGDDRGMKDNGRQGTPTNAGEASNSNAEAEGPQENRGQRQHPDRPGSSAQSSPVRGNPVQTANDSPQHVVHRPPVAGSNQNADAGQGHGQNNDQGRNNATDSQSSSTQQDTRHGRGPGLAQAQGQYADQQQNSGRGRGPGLAQPPGQSAAESAAQSNVPTESNSSATRVVPRPPVGRGMASEPSSPAQSQSSASTAMSSGHSASPIAQPPMHEQNDSSAGRNVPHPPESNRGFSVRPQQQPAAPAEQPASRPMPSQNNAVSTPSAARQAASPVIMRTAAPQTAAHGNNHASAPQPQAHASSQAKGHSDKSEKQSGPPQH